MGVKTPVLRYLPKYQDPLAAAAGATGGMTHLSQERWGHIGFWSHLLATLLINLICNFVFNVGKHELRALYFLFRRKKCGSKPGSF